MIDMLDLFEETRPLSTDEFSLRSLCRSTLERLVLMRAARWKQRGKFRAVVEGDENTRFFHARASQRMRRNSIRTLDVAGVTVASHDAKAAALFSYYNGLLGRCTDAAWDFDIDDLYSGCPTVDGAALVGPFSAHEIERAVRSMDRSSAPGPDGLGPGFYRAAWGTIRPGLERLFESFASRSADLQRLNRAHVVLLPKGAGARTPGAFRPVSLQNCSIKSICKALTTRLQHQIAALIDTDQTGFLSGCSISESFVHATELVQTCFRRRAPCVVLKLDFAKAFDSVSWASLRRIMLARGFPVLWCDWMDDLFSSSRSAILLNGVPGKWIRCLRGLRQGDPLSPYLFLLTADVLQRLIRRDDVLQHPLVDGAPCPVLQYADDTLIILRADAGAAARLKLLLHRFERATGLCINYGKSTIVPMHVDAATLGSIQQALGCRVEGFPQAYLGLPLSAEKLRLSAFAPLIAKVDRYLSGWRALLLSPGGRLVLINAVLDALPTFAMGALELPPGVLAALDRLRRAFLWAASDRVSGAQCLVSWDTVCRSKAEGGLGVRSLKDVNSCLLVKLLHRLHVAPSESWPRWVWSSLDGLPLDTPGAASPLDGAHWNSLRRLLPLYRGISRVSVGDGNRTSFWFDCWHPSGVLGEAMPALLSHCTLPEATVRQVVTCGIDAFLVPRLSSAASRQRDDLARMVAGVALSGSPDQRSLPLCSKKGGALLTSALYKLCTTGGVVDAHVDFVWRCMAPSRVKFFAWLLIKGHIQCRENLRRKGILDEAGSVCPICAAPAETTGHIMFGCPFARSFWAAIGAPATSELAPSDFSSCCQDPIFSIS